MAAPARNTAGVPWAKDIRQLAASGRSLELQFLKTMKCAVR